VINLSGQFDISDDGSMLVYLGPGGQLWVRRWQDLAASPIDGTEGARRVTLSPDGTRIAFSVLGDQVSVLALSGGSARHIVQGRWPFWGPDDYIYVSVPEGTVRMRAEGGSPEPVTHRGEAEVGEHIITDLLPGGEGVLVIVGSEAESWVVAGHVRTGEMERLMPGRRAYYASTGHLVVLTGTGDVMAARFDPDAMELRGDAVALIEDVGRGSLSRSGTFVYTADAGTGLREFVWVTRSGQVEPLGWRFRAGTQLLRSWSLSPDDTRLAFTADEADPGSANVWIKELPDGPMTLLADEEGLAWGPRWRSDGETVTYTLGETGSRVVVSRRADGAGEVEELFDGFLDASDALLSPDEEWLLLRVALLGVAGRGIMAMRPEVDSVPLPLLDDDGYNATQPALSPDGRWLAYTSDESGRSEVYVRPFPDTDTGRNQVSTDGGLQPLWAHSGRELFFVSANREMWAAQYETASGFRVVGRELLFEIPSEFLDVLSSLATNYDISSDDEMFLMARAVLDSGSASYSGFVVVTHWTEELKRLVPN